MQVGDIVTTTESLTMIRRAGGGPAVLYIPAGTYCKIEVQKEEGTRVRLLTLGRSALLPTHILRLAWRPRVPVRPGPSAPLENQSPDAPQAD